MNTIAAQIKGNSKKKPKGLKTSVYIRDVHRFNAAALAICEEFNFNSISELVNKLIENKYNEINGPNAFQKIEV